MKELLNINYLKSHGLLTLAGFNEGAFKSYIKQYTTPILSSLLWAVPSVAACMAVVDAISYLMKDQEDRDRQKFTKSLKKILIVTIIAETIVAIFNIVGIVVN